MKNVESLQKNVVSTRSAPGYYVGPAINSTSAYAFIKKTSGLDAAIWLPEGG
jgi:hypothetical protein